MTYQPQRIEAPDGTELVVITRAEYDRLVDAHGDEDARDARLADLALAEGDLRYPAPVMDAMLAGDTPVAAWRKHRGMSQADLAAKTGMTQAGVSRLETRREGITPVGRLATRRALAKALDVPVAALEPLEE